MLIERVGALGGPPGRCSALPGGELVAAVASPTEVALWSAERGALLLDACLHGQTIRGVPAPRRVRDVATFRVPPLGSLGALACVCVGFETGELRVFRDDGAFLFATRAHASEVRRVRVRSDSELAVLQDGALVLIDGLSLRGVLHSCAREARSATSWGPASTMPAVESLRWALPSLGGSHRLGALTDAFCCGRPPAGPFEVDSSISDERCFVLASSGAQACLQTVLAPDDDAGGSAADVALDALFSAVSSVTSVTGLFWRRGGGGGAGGGGEESAGSEPNATAAPPPVALKPVRSLADPPRGVRDLSVHPCGTWGAASDSLGRVSLVELPSLIVRRMWRGYRDAQCAWLVAENAGADGGSSVHLAIYAPLRGLLELWPLPCGPRAAALSVGTGGRLVGGCSTPSVAGDEGGACVFVSEGGEVHRVTAASGSQRDGGSG